MMLKLALVDDHVLLRNGLANLLRELDYDVIIEADSGIDFLEKLKRSEKPEIVLMDINMPNMDGYGTTQWLRNKFPEIKVLALSMYDDENSIIKMLRSGARGYILKDSEPSELTAALIALQKKGFYHSELVTGKLIHSINHAGEKDNAQVDPFGLNDREVNFLKFCCSEMTYKEIADQMNLSPRTIDGYRDDLFEKFQLKNRVGLVLFAIKNGIVKI
jgi:two-component system invasion response regulator UvrY